jgi:hypothetical protein
MRCAEVRDHLERRSRVGLDAETQGAIQAHLAECRECRLDWEAAVALQNRLPHLPREIQPAADLWTEIAPRLARSGQRRGSPVWRFAAAALLLMAASSSVTWLLVRRPAVATTRSIRSLEADYARAARELTQLYDAARSALSPETRAVLEANLVVIERALGEARAALESDPTNPALAAIVATAYRRKIEFLEQATTLDRET